MRRYRVIASARRRHRASASDQRGVALLIVLAAILLTSAVLMALLGLSFTSSRVTASQAQTARDQRVADGALETAVGRIARSAAVNPCTDVPANSPLEFAGESADPANPTVVEVRCDPLPLPAEQPGDESAEVLGGPAVEIVGSSYAGGITSPGPMIDPTLIHEGETPLEFESDVTVARGAAVRTSDPDGPAVAATGQYLQGQLGPAGAPGSECGELDEVAGVPESVIDDRDSTPECLSADAANLSPRSGTIFSPSDDVSDRDVPSSCPAGAVVTFLEGRYDAIDTARLNKLLNGTCTNKTFWFTPGKYSFDVNDAAAPSTDRHALVINDPTAKIVFGEANGWGTSPDGAPPSSFPRACDAGRTGASIQLSGRTTLRHRAGRIAICPAINPVTETPLPAIVQSDGAPSQPLLVSSTAPAGGWFPTAYTRCFTFVWVECRNNNTPATRQHSDRSFETRWASAGAAPLTSAQLLIETRENPPAHNAERYVIVTVRSSTNAFICTTGVMDAGRTNGQHSIIDLTSESQNGIGNRCADVLRSPGVTEAIFEGARITITHRYYDTAGAIAETQCGPLSGTLSGCTVDLWVGDVQLRTNATTAVGSSATGASWQVPSNAVVRDQNVSSVYQPEKCTGIGLPLEIFLLFVVAESDARCRHDLPGPRSITASGFTPVSAGGVPGGERVEHLSAVISSRTGSPRRSWASLPVDETSMRFDLKLAGDPGPDPSCSVTNEGFFRSIRPAAIDLLADGGTCRAVLETVSQLEGASLTVTYQADCLWLQDFRAPIIPWSGKCDMVTMPEIDQIAFSLTTDAVPRPQFGQVTVDSSEGAAGTSFNVFGDTLLPGMDLDIRWRGGVTELPIFGGFLSVNALASDQSAGAATGVVCCTPPPVTTLRLQALMNDGEVVAETFLYVGPPGSGGLPPEVLEPRRSIGVLDWKFCGRGGCALGQAQSAPSG